MKATIENIHKQWRYRIFLNWRMYETSDFDNIHHRASRPEWAARSVFEQNGLLFFFLSRQSRGDCQRLVPSLLVLVSGVGFSGLRYFNVCVSWEDDFIEDDLMLVKNEEFKGIFDNDNYAAVLTLCDDSFTKEKLELIRELDNEMIERLSYADFFGKNSAMRRPNRSTSSSITPFALCGEKMLDST